MSIIETIRAEVERLKKNVDNSPLAPEQIAGYLLALADMQKKLDTLQEQPVKPSVEEAMKELDEKIAQVKKAGSWKNPELLDEMRYEQPACEETIYTLNGLMQQFIKEGENDAEQERRQRAYNAFFDAMDYEPEPVCEGFSDEFDRYFLPKNREKKGRWGFADIYALARHFYELGRQSKPKVSEDLEEAAKNYEYEKGHIVYPSIKEVFIDGASWQKEQDEEIINAIGDIPGDIEKAYHNGRKDMKEQMMNGAVEGKVAESIRGKLFIRCPVPETMNLDFCDKVRVIILPKED